MFNLICNKLLSIEIHDIEVHEYPYRQPCSQYFGNPLNCNLGSTLRILILFNFYTKIGKNVCSAWLRLNKLNVKIGLHTTTTTRNISAVTDKILTQL